MMFFSAFYVIYPSFPSLSQLWFRGHHEKRHYATWETKL